MSGQIKWFFRISILNLLFLSCSHPIENKCIIKESQNKRVVLCGDLIQTIEYDSLGRVMTILSEHRIGSTSVLQKFFDNGKLESIESFVNGRKNGSASYFHRNGKIATTASFIDNNKNLWSIWYDTLGRARYKEFHLTIDNKVEWGNTIEYDANGNAIRSRSKYVNMILTDSNSVIDFVNAPVRELNLIYFLDSNCVYLFGHANLGAFPVELDITDSIYANIRYGCIAFEFDTLNSKYYAICPFEWRTQNHDNLQ
jgi:hypothetical protein